MIPYMTPKCSFTFYLRYSFTPPEFFYEVGLSDGRHLYIDKFESNEPMLSRLIFYLKSVNLFFLFSI